MGTWYKKPRVAKPVHVHDYPTTATPEDDIVAGDRYQCGPCGGVFEVTALMLVGSAGDRLINWKRVHGYGVMEDTRDIERKNNGF